MTEAPVAALDALFAADPGAAARDLHGRGPVVWSDAFFGGAWLVSRYEDVQALLKDTRLSARRTGGWVKQAQARDGGSFAALQALLARTLLFLDGEDHLRLRHVLASALRPEHMPELLALLDTWVRTLLADASAAGATGDFIEQVARPLPALLTAHLMGASRDDLPRFAAWAAELQPFVAGPRADAGMTRQAQVALLAMARYFEARLQREDGRSAHWVGHVARAVREGRMAAGPEALAQCALLLFATQETTRHLLGNVVHAALSVPGLWQRLCRAPQDIPAMIRESLRHDSPVQYTARRVAVPMDLQGCSLRRGDLVLLLLGAAQRDPRRFDRPDTFDCDRERPHTLAFGAGAHACLGAALSRVQAQVVVQGLLAHRPTMALAGSPHWLRSPLHRGLARLPVRWQAGAPVTGDVSQSAQALAGGRR